MLLEWSVIACAYEVVTTLCKIPTDYGVGESGENGSGSDISLSALLQISIQFLLK